MGAGGYDFKMAKINQAGSRLAQEGGKTFLTPQTQITVPNTLIPEVVEHEAPNNLGDPRQVMPMRGTQKGG